MSWLTAPFRALWWIAQRFQLRLHPAFRPGTNAAAVMMFIFLLFFVIGVMLVLLGFDLEQVDQWIDRQESWLDALATILFRGFCLMVVLIGGWTVVGGLMQRTPLLPNEDKIGWGQMAFALFISYFAWFGVTG